jgi:DNA repair exonuclease SbcCD ATPase subunit
LAKKKEEITKTLEDCKSELESTVNSIFLTEELKKCIKMYISYSFDEALESIGAKSTEIIRCIPNMSNATIQFEGTKETKDGKIKEEVNAVIGMDGETGVPIKSLSGGERSAVDLAVDLAVIDFIETKSAKGMNIFILDEPFTGLGTVEIEMALEVLKNSNTNKKIIIVDHNPEVKQMVQSRIIVEREGTSSRLVG